MATTTVRVHGTRTDTGIYENYTKNYSYDPEIAFSCTRTAARSSKTPSTVTVSITGTNLHRENGYYGNNIWIFASKNATNTSASNAGSNNNSDILLISRDTAYPDYLRDANWNIIYENGVPKEDNRYWDAISGKEGEKTLTFTGKSLAATTVSFYIKTMANCSECNSSLPQIGSNDFGIANARTVGDRKTVAKITINIPDIRVNAGSIKAITDKGNNYVTITASSGTARNTTLNAVTSNRIYYRFKINGSWNYTWDDTDIPYAVFTTENYTTTIAIPANATSIEARVKTFGEAKDADGNRDSASGTVVSETVVYYTPPKAPSKMWINTGKSTDYPDKIKSSYNEDATSTQTENNAIKPRAKNLLMWKWSGYEGGTNAEVAGFRVFIYKNSTTCDNNASVQISKPYGINTVKKGDGSIAETLVEIGSAETGSNNLGFYCDIGVDLINEDNTQFGFIPIDEGFLAKDICTCKVYTYSYWGDYLADGVTKIKHFSDNTFDGVLDFLTGSCTLFNSAIVWVKTGTGNTDWVEGVPWVKTESGWTEAESVHVKQTSSTWKEST